jgi:hypothetical protein
VDLRELLKNATPSDSEPEVAALLLHAFPRKDTARALPRQKKKKKNEEGRPGRGGEKKEINWKRRAETAAAPGSGNDARAPVMVEPPQTLALAALILLNLLLTAAALYVNVRRFLRARRRALQQRQEQTLPRPPPPGPEASAREQHAQEEEEADEGGREKQQQRRRRRARRRRQQQQQQEGEGAGGGGDGDAAAPAAKAAGRDGKAEEESLLPRRPQFPLASVAGALQRRINARYDDLARASEARCLTIEQVPRGARIPLSLALLLASTPACSVAVCWRLGGKLTNLLRSQLGIRVSTWNVVDFPHANSALNAAQLMWYFHGLSFRYY